MLPPIAVASVRQKLKYLHVARPKDGVKVKGKKSFIMFLSSKRSRSIFILVVYIIGYFQPIARHSYIARGLRVGKEFHMRDT